MPVRVSELEQAHFAAWEIMWREYQAFYRIDIPEATARRVWARLFDEAEPVFGRIAFLDGQAAGVAHCVLQRSFWSVADNCYLHDLYVSQRFRRQGVAQALIASVCEGAARAARRRVHWLTHEDNRAAGALYERVAKRTGFLQYAIATPAA